MSKKRGIAAERELFHLLAERNYAVARVAGSGSMPEPSCDLLAGNGKQKYAIECKTSRAKKKYLSKQQIEEFINFASRFGLKPLLAIRFVREGWFFVLPSQLEDTGKGLAISIENARRKGKKLF